MLSGHWRASRNPIPEPRYPLLRLRYQCEERALRITALHDPGVARHFVRAHDYLAAVVLDALCCGVDIVHVEVEVPERGGRVRHARHDGAGRGLPVLGKDGVFT